MANRKARGLFRLHRLLNKCPVWVLVPLLLASNICSAQIFDKADAARTRALESDAALLATETFEDAENALQKGRRDAEKDNIERAWERAADAERLYEQAELEAIEAEVLGEARTALSVAINSRAKKYAPRTLEKAETLSRKAAAAIENDRYNTEAAAKLADEATAVAGQAMRIAALAREKPTAEDLLLAQEAALQTLQKAAGQRPKSGQPLDQMVTDLDTEIARLHESVMRLSADLSDSRNFAAAMEDEIRELDKKLGGANDEREKLRFVLEEQARKRESLDQTQALFAAHEATVIQQSETVIVRLVGLSFASGSASLGKSNDALLAKVAQVVALYPDAMLTVEGHTDSQGGDRLNQQLSQNRAQEVLNFIVTNMRVPSHRISAAGFGESRPIGNNETPEGRAQNRRIDLLINTAGL